MRKQTIFVVLGHLMIKKNMIHVPDSQDDDFVFAAQHRKLIKLDKHIWPNIYECKIYAKTRFWTV